MLSHFRFALIFTFVGLMLSGVWGFTHGVNAGLEMMLKMLCATLFLAFLEVSLSVNNVVINTSVLKQWDQHWRKIYLTLGVLVAALILRLILPVFIVAFATDMSLTKVVNLAINNPLEYAYRLRIHYVEIAAFCGMLLFMVFLNFVFIQIKHFNWVKRFEDITSEIGSLEILKLILGICLIFIITSLIPENHQSQIIKVSLMGVFTYYVVRLLGLFLSKKSLSNAENGLIKTGVSAFLFLEILDASQSVSSVFGAFAITTDIVVILIGLTIGAVFARSLTIYLLENDSIISFKYLDLAANYVVGLLAASMLLAVVDLHIPQLMTAIIGFFVFAWALFATVKDQKIST